MIVSVILSVALINIFLGLSISANPLVTIINSDVWFSRLRYILSREIYKLYCKIKEERRGLSCNKLILIFFIELKINILSGVGGILKIRKSF